MLIGHLANGSIDLKNATGPVCRKCTTAARKLLLSDADGGVKGVGRPRGQTTINHKGQCE